MNPPLTALMVMDDDAFPQVFGPEERTALAECATLVAPPLSATTLPRHSATLDRVEAVFTGWGAPPFDEALLARLPACRIVFHAAGSARGFITPALWRQGIRVTTAADVNAIPVAEFTCAAIIFSLKHAWARIAELRDRHEYRRTDPTMPGAYGSTVGLLALSRTGRLVAERLRALDVRVIAHDPVCSPTVARALNVELCPLEEVFSRADVVSCHLPLLPATAGRLMRRHFAAMKPGATFINTARGGLVSEEELISVLRARPDLTAVLDVQQQEPLPVDSPLFALPNIVLTPHIAGSLGPECRRMGRFVIDEARRYQAGEPLHGEIRAADLATTA